ncbi:putative DUF4398 domain-containing protein [Gammaproteobacteria bacterium]
MCRKVKPSRWVGLVATVILFGCANAPPIQEMSDARQSVRAAVEAGAEHYFPTIMERVDALLTKAEKELAVADFRGAEQHALAAKTEAVRARSLVLTLTSTIETVEQAERVTKLDPNTRAVLQQAQDAASQGNEAVTMAFMEQARQEAESALEDYDLERAQTLAANLRSEPKRLRNSALREALEAAEAAVRHHEGHRAYGLLAPYVPH